MSNGLPRPNLGANWTPLTRNVIVTLFAVYVAQLLSQGAITQWFAWQPFGQGFKAWQVATSFFLGGEPLGTVVSWLVLYFVLAPLDGMLGRKGLVQGVAVTWASGVLFSAVLLAMGLVNAPHVGLGPLLAAMVAMFGFMMPNAQFLLMFIVPVRAIWVAWATGLLSFLYLLYAHDLGSSLTFFGWCGASGWIALRAGGVRRIRLLLKKRQIERKLSRFEVIEGGRQEKHGKRSEPSDWVH